MKLPLSWIKEIIELDAPSHQIATMLTNAGLEVDAVAPLPLNFEKVVVGEVGKTEPHPHADNLRVAVVSNGAESFQVVCGAPNCREGIKTAFAMVGARLTGPDEKVLKVKKTKIRGVESLGMLCSEAELGLGEDHDGIMEFAEHIHAGADISEIYGDTVFEISLTPNLGHCASVVGVARELSAVTEKPIKIPEPDVREDSSQPVGQQASVEISDWEKCPRYACRVIKNVKVEPSPAWLQKRLLACDLRPVNNIVDITNYVLMELGHPLHAFDYDLVDGHQIIVRKAEKEEPFVTLDGKHRTLCDDDLLICDQSKPVAIAGVMGGQNSEVNENTVSVLLESAYFEPAGIRRTSKRLGLQTDASRRFERGADPNNVLKALDRAAGMIQSLAGGTVCEGVIDACEKDFKEWKVDCRLSRINKVLGTQLSLSEVESVFHRLGMGYAWDGQDLFTVAIPTYRVDISREEDLIEEVARIYGFDNIPKEPAVFTSSRLPHSPIYLFENEVRSRLIAEGLQEFVTCDLVGPSLLQVLNEKIMPQEAEVKVLNPTSIEQSVLRTSLLPGLLQVAKYNHDHGVHSVCGFEVGRVHFKKDEQYKEQSVAAILMTGRAGPVHWDSKERECDFFDLKGIIENLFNELRAGKPTFKNNEIKVFHPGRQASIYVDSLEVGTMGEVHPAVIRRLDIPQRILFAEIDLHDLINTRKFAIQMEEVPIYPASSRDLTVTLDNEVPVQEIFDAVYSIPSRLLEKAALIDVYRSEKLGQGKKNVTLRFIYRNKKKTVAQEAVDAEHARITSQIEARIRR